jgi:hypothetical protein
VGSLQPGDVFGEVALLTKAPRQADCVAARRQVGVDLPCANKQAWCCAAPNLNRLSCPALSHTSASNSACLLCLSAVLGRLPPACVLVFTTCVSRKYPATQIFSGQSDGLGACLTRLPPACLPVQVQVPDHDL